MNTAEQILVVILSTALAVLLVLAIVAMTMIIRLVGTLRIIAGKAEHAVESVESIGAILKNTAAPIGLFRFVRGVVDMVTQHKRKEK